MGKSISPERQGAYLFGMVLVGIGLCLFLSTFLSMMSGFGAGPSIGGSGDAGMGGVMGRALGGMLLMAIGRGVMRVGARGVAGSGLILDPDQARKDLSPYSKMAGGMAKDALEEAGIDLRRRGEDAAAKNKTEPVIMLRCPQCQTLNEDGSKFCQECGAKL